VISIILIVVEIIVNYTSKNRRKKIKWTFGGQNSQKQKQKPNTDKQ